METATQDLIRSFEYQILYEDAIHNLTDYLSGYISFNKLYNLYRNQLKINNIYKTDEAAGSLIRDSLNEPKVFNYYNRYNQKAFVNVDGHYIVDPYDTWIEGETYYEPV